MDKYIKEIKVFTFPELNGEAKEKAKEWYLNDETLSWELTDSYESDLSCIFPNSDLKVQWSLSYCQGDGVNIYGSVNMEDIFSLPQNAPAYNWIDGYLTEKEIRTLRFYMSEYKNEVKIPVNRRYSYCMADSIDLAEDFRYELENMGIRDIRETLQCPTLHVLPEERHPQSAPSVCGIDSVVGRSYDKDRGQTWKRSETLQL